MNMSKIRLLYLELQLFIVALCSFASLGLLLAIAMERILVESMSSLRMMEWAVGLVMFPVVVWTHWLIMSVDKLKEARRKARKKVLNVREVV